ncbi:hypothetical protein QI7_1423 [Clostridioides difficile 6042]|nr:hypothetical protein QI7_1423 [Clostridioides difficile 6042]
MIGRRCKCSNVFSLSILIGRGLDQYLFDVHSLRYMCSF